MVSTYNSKLMMFFDVFPGNRQLNAATGSIQNMHAKHA